MEIETLNHFLFEYQYRKKIWNLVQKVLNRALERDLSMIKLEILTGYFEYDHDMVIFLGASSPLRSDFFVSESVCHHFFTLFPFADFDEIFMVDGF